MDPRLDKQREAGDNSMKSFAFHTLQHILLRLRNPDTV